ncbi:hypothetical protein Esti_000676 [Eimeria stiedai]
MLESLLLPHLNTALSAVFEDLETHQVEASILGGSLVLRDLKIKEDALAALSLPIDVSYGHVGTLVVKLNLLRFMTEPIVICAEDVLLIATTQHPSAWSIEREQSLRDQQRNLILLTDECLTYAREESGLPSLLQRAVYKLIQKLRLSIKGLELRLEDTETSSKQAFAIGLRATRLYNIQCSSNWDADCQEVVPSSIASAAALSNSRPIPLSSATQSYQGWFEWMTGFGRKHKKNGAPSFEGIPESFHIKTVLQDAALYVDPLNAAGPHLPWLPYPASYRQQLLSDVEELILKKRYFLSAVEAGVPIPFGCPVDGGGPGCANPTSIGNLIQSLRRRQRMPDDQLNFQDAAAKARGGHENVDTIRNRGIRRRRISRQARTQVDMRADFVPARGVRSLSSGKPGSPCKDQKHKSGNQLLVRTSDLYSPEALLQLAAVTAQNHFYIVQPADVEIRARCAQRPTAAPAGMQRAFCRPFASSSSGNSKGNAPQPDWENSEASAQEDKYLPPLSVAVIFQSIRLHVIPVQLASLCRWLHFGTILYQEFVSGVYAECVGITPGDEEVERYKRAWERHLLAYAFAATGGDSVLSHRAIEPPVGGAFDPAVEAREGRDELEDLSNADIISSFETKYWPTVTIPLRQQVLQNLQQRACFRCGRRLGDGSLGGSFHRQGFDRSATSRLVEGVAGELSLAATATANENFQALKCIEKMKPHRFSKSIQFTAEFSGLELTLSGAQGIKDCIHVELAELAVHVTFYYDLRVSVVVAFEGVQVKDNLLPDLAHRQVLTGDPPPRDHWLLQEAPAPHSSWGGTQSSLSACSGLQKNQATSKSNPLSGKPPMSPLQSDGGNCILDWNSACFWHNAGCPFGFYQRGGSVSREEKNTSQGAQAGGWLRVVKVYVPVEGVPDIVFHVQTHGSILCTITPAAVANLVQTLQEPVCLMEKSQLLQMASCEVQEVFHRNEMLMAKLLLGDFEHTSIDICVDIPVPHHLLLPFDHKDSKCRGVLLQSGRIFVDTLLQNSRVQPFTMCDRYLATASGTCVQRVFDCATVKRFPREPRDACTFSTPRFSVAASRTKERELAFTPDASEATSSDVLPVSERRSSRRRQSHADVIAGQRAECKPQEGYSGVTQELAGSQGSTGSEVADEAWGFILWPAGIVCCLDICPFSRPLDVPQIRLIVQDQAFSGVCVSLSDGDLVALCCFLAEVLNLLQPLLALWNASSFADQEPASASDDAPELSVDSLDNLTSETGSISIRKKELRATHGRRTTALARLTGSRARQCILRAGTSGNLSSVSRNSIGSVHSPLRYSALRRITFYIHRTLRANGAAESDCTQLSSSDSGEHLALTDKKDGEWESSSGTDRGRRAAKIGPPMQQVLPIVKTPEAKSGCSGEGQERGYDGVKKNIASERDKATTEQQNLTQVASKNLIHVDLRLGLSRFELLLLREGGVARQNPTMPRENLFGSSRHCMASEFTSGTGSVTFPHGQAAGTSEYYNHLVVKFAMGNARMRIYSVSLASRCKYEATCDNICLSLGPLHGEHSAVISALESAKELKPNSSGVIGTTKKDGEGRRTKGSKTSHCFQDHVLAGKVWVDGQAGAASPLILRRFPRAVPFLQFNANKNLTSADCAADAANAVATVLLGATTSCYSRDDVPPVSFTELQSALSSRQLYASKRWAFPPPYSTEQKSHICAPEAPREEELEQHSSSTQHTFKCVGSQSNSFSGDQQDNFREGSLGSHSKSEKSALAGSHPFADLREEEEVLIEDLATGRCFLVPSALHAIVATDATWQHLTLRDPDLILSGSLCLISLLHSLDARCNPVRVTLDWTVLSGLIGFAMEVFNNATEACAAFRLPASAADEVFQKSDLGSDYPRRLPCTASEEPKKHNRNALFREDGSLDARLFLGGADIPPWRISIGVVVELCELVIPTNTSSPYPDMQPSLCLLAERGSIWTNWTTGPPQWTANRHPNPNQNDAQLKRSNNRQIERLRASVSAQDCQPGFSTSFETSGEPFVGDKVPWVTQEMLAATCPPIFVFSSSLSLSYYSESRMLNSFDEVRPCQGGAGAAEASSTEGMLSALHQTTNRLLCSAQQIHAELLQPSGGSQDNETLVHFLQKGRLKDKSPCTKDRRPPRLARCLRPPTFGSPEVPSVTLLDIRKHPSVANSNGMEHAFYRGNPDSSTASGALVAGRSPLLNDLRRPCCKKIQDLAMSAHTLINGCRWLCKASFTQAEVLDERAEPPSPSARRDTLRGGNTGKNWFNKGEEEATGACSAGGRLQRHESKPETSFEALVEVDPLMVNLAPAVVAAGASLLQVLDRTKVAGQPAAAGAKGCTHVDSLTSELLSDVVDTERKGTRDSALVRLLQFLFLAWQLIERLVQMQQRSVSTAGVVSQASRASAAAQVRTALALAGLGIALNDETGNTGSAAPWLWTFCHSIDAVITVRVRIECIRLESPTLELTVEDLDVFGTLERPYKCGSAAFQNLVKKLRYKENEIVIRSVRDQAAFGNQRLKASISRPSTMKNLGRRRDKPQTISRVPKVPWKAPSEQQNLHVEVSENLLSFHMRLILTAEALHRARMAIESVLEPWSCAVNIKYVPGDLLVALAARQPEDGGKWQCGEASLSLCRKASIWRQDAKLRNRSSMTKQRLRIMSGRIARDNSLLAPDREYTGRKKTHIRTLSKWAQVQIGRNDITDRSRCLQRLAKTWGKDGAELQGEIECSWINLTIAPFLLDAIVETAELIEAAHCSMNLLPTWKRWSVGWLADSSEVAPSPSPSTSSTPSCDQDAQNRCKRQPRNSHNHSQPGVSTSRKAATRADKSYPCRLLENELENTDPDSRNVLKPPKMEVCGQNSDPPYEKEPSSKSLPESTAREVLRKDHTTPLLVNLSGQSISVYVPKRFSPPRQGYGELSPIAETTHLATDAFAFERRKALVEHWGEAQQAGSGLRGAGESKPPLEGGYEQIALTGNPAETERLSGRFDSSHSCNTPAPGGVTGVWRKLGHEESLEVPLDDHGQPLKLTIRVHLIGSEFEISGLKLDASNIGVRELPLKIPAVDQHLAKDPHKNCQPDFLAFTARILVRTVLTPDSRAFSTYLSSMVSVRNNSSMPIMILPHPALSLLGSQDSTKRQKLHCITEKRDTQPTAKHLCSTPHLCLRGETLLSRSSISECFGKRDTSKVPRCCPLEVKAHGGVGHIPLSWILPRAFVAYGLQLRGVDDSSSSFETHNADDEMAPTIDFSSVRASKSPTRHMTEQSLSHTSCMVDSSQEVFTRRTRSADSNFYCENSSSVSSVSLKEQHRPGLSRDRVVHIKQIAHHDKVILGNTAEWRGDTAVEPLLVIPSRCLASAFPHLHLIENSTGNRTRSSRAWSTGTSTSKGGHRPQVVKTSRLRGQLDEKKHSQQLREDPVSVSAYYDIYLLALSLGAKPLVEPSTIQQIATGGSHSVLDYDLIPQVLEFDFTSSNDVVPGWESSLGCVQGEIQAGRDDSNIGKGRHPVIYSALAITVYGKSRDLVSEAEPLFFEVAVNAPISLGNRLFESLRVLVVPSSKWALQDQAEVPKSALGPDQHKLHLPYGSMNAGEDIDIYLSASGFVFELEARGGGAGFQNIYRSKPLSINFHIPASADAMDVAIPFTRVGVVGSEDKRIQQHSVEYRLIARQQPPEFSLLAEVLGWANQNFSRSTPNQETGLISLDDAWMDIKTHVWSTCVRKIRVFAPFWMANRQLEPLYMSYCHRPLQYVAPGDWRLLGIPFQEKALITLGVPPWDETGNLLLPRRIEGNNVVAEETSSTCCRQTSGVKLCTPFCADIVGHSMAICVPTPSFLEKLVRSSPKRSTHFGVTVSLAPPPFSRSKIISIYNRFVLKSLLPYDIWVKESMANTPPLWLEKRSQKTFHPQALGPRGEALICIATAHLTIRRDTPVGGKALTTKYPSPVDTGHAIERMEGNSERNIWSSQLSIARNSTLQIRVKKVAGPALDLNDRTALITARNGLDHVGSGGYTYLNIRVTIQLVENASFVVIFSEAVSSEYVLVNQTNHLIAFTQGGIRGKEVWELLQKGQQVDYAWTDPQKERKLLRFSFWEGNQQIIRSCDIARVRVHRPLTLPKSKETIYFITDVCGSRRRVTATTIAPSSKERLSGKDSNTWRNLPHEILKRHRRQDVGGTALGTGKATNTVEAPKPFSRKSTSSCDSAAPYEQPSWCTPRRGTVPQRRHKSSRHLTPAGGNMLAPLTSPALEGGPTEVLHSSHSEVLARKVLRFQQSGLQPLENSQGVFDVNSGEACTISLKGCGDKDLELESLDTNNSGHLTTELGGTHRKSATRQTRKKSFSLSKHETFGASAVSASPDCGRGSGVIKRSQEQWDAVSHRTATAHLDNGRPHCENPSSESPLSVVGFCLRVSIKGFGVSLVESTPQELAYVCCSGIRTAVRRVHGTGVLDFRFSISTLQIDNGVDGAHHQTILRQTTNEERMAHQSADGKLGGPEDEAFTLSGASEKIIQNVIMPFVIWDASEAHDFKAESLFLRFQLGGRWQQDATLLEYVDVELAPIAVHIEADTTLVLMRFMFRLLQNRNLFLRYLQDRNVQLVRQAASGAPESLGYKQLRAFPEAKPLPQASFRPLYIRAICIRPMLILFTARSQRRQRKHFTSEHDELLALRHFEVLGDKMADITNFPLKSRLFLQRCLFATLERLVADLVLSYTQQCIRQLHKLVASIDLIGNPLRLVTGVSSGFRSLINQPFEEANESDSRTWTMLKSLCMLVLNVASEIFASFSSIAGGLVKILEMLGLIDVGMLLSFWPETMRVQRTRIERPETIFDGCCAGGIGALQVLGASVWAVAALPVARARQSGCLGFCKGTLEGLSSLAAGLVVSGLVLVTSVAAGVSYAVRRKPLIAKTRAPRVFPPNLAVSPYAMHAAQAMNLLQSSTKASLTSGVLQRVITAFPLYCIRSTRSTKQSTFEDTVSLYKDYLIVTSDLIVCLHDSQARWVCRREDIDRCIVKVPAFLLDAFRAQQDLFLKRRQRTGTAVLRDEKLHAKQKEDPLKGNGSPYVVQITIRNELRLPEKVILDFAAAYKAYVSHATLQRNLAHTFTKRIKSRERLYKKDCSISFHDPNSNSGHLRATFDTPGTFSSAMKEPPSPNEVPPTYTKSNYDWHGRQEALASMRQTAGAVSLESINHGEHLPLWWSLNCCKRRRRGRAGFGAGHTAGKALRPGILKLACLDWSSQASPLSPPDTVTVTISAPDSAAALRIFDIICSVRGTKAVAPGNRADRHADKNSRKEL